MDARDSSGWFFSTIPRGRLSCICGWPSTVPVNTARYTAKEKRSMIGGENGKNVSSSQSKLEKGVKMKVISQESIYVQTHSARFGSAYPQYTV
jgi:hypothetical protein